ncbi:hypothetical protein WMY93_018686 [Mugilogobius chulae]|uniref:Uncharacterized protein n=1 Tax=Mugilogobius chulae TaxID=88201 RepID=A0AAW0NPI3_9GOBI
MFYNSVVASAIFYGVVCWGSGVKVADTNRLNKLVKKAGSVLGVELEPVGEVAERRILKKLLRSASFKGWFEGRLTEGASRVASVDRKGRVEMGQA